MARKKVTKKGAGGSRKSLADRVERQRDRFSKIEFLNRLPSASTLGEDVVLIYDRRLSQLSKEFSQWSQTFSVRYPVTAGEALKDIKKFPGHIERLTSVTDQMNSRRMKFVVVGGGSVGDFGGFIASVFKRGIPLIHIPTTWLAAIDSSHGGKTALNVGGVKNQIGTFYMAERVLVVRSLLFMQPQDRATEAFGELAKIAIIDGGSWVRRLASFKGSNEERLWRFLKPAIEAKMKVVARDPREAAGVRQLLNLGHTVGHVLESALEMPHGLAVAEGLIFALRWSFQRGHMAQKEYVRVHSLVSDLLKIAPKPKRAISAQKFLSLLLKDKKKSASDSVTYIWMKKVGQVFREPIDVRSIVEEARRQGWVR